MENPRSTSNRLDVIEQQLLQVRHDMGGQTSRDGNIQPPLQVRLAKTVSTSGGGSYPTEPADTFGILFVDGTYTQTAGNQNNTQTDRRAAPAVEVAHSIKRKYYPVNTRVWVVRQNHKWWIVEEAGDMFRHGKVYGSPITAGGTGTVELWFYNGAAEANSAVQITARDWLQNEYAAGEEVEVMYEARSAQWYLLPNGDSSASADTLQWVVVGGSDVIDDGLPVAPFGFCLWSGAILTIEPTAATFCEGDDRYTAGASVWIMSVDALNGSGSSAPRLYKGDRFLGKLVGTYDISGDSRPLYAVRKGTQHDIVRVVGESAEAVTGGNVTPSAAGLWNGEVLYVTPGATTFVGGATPYTSGPQCWILAPDLPGGSVDNTARLKHNDRHPAIYLGEFDDGTGARPLYAIRMTTHFGWIKFKLNYALTTAQSSQASTVLEYWGTKSPAPGPLSVFNLETNVAGTFVFHGNANAVGYAVWDEKLARYKIIVIESDSDDAHGGLLRQGTSSTMAAGATWKIVEFSAEMDSSYGVTLATGASAGITVTNAGIYYVSFAGSQRLSAAPAGVRSNGSFSLYKNGAALAAYEANQDNIETYFHRSSIVAILRLAAGDKIDVRARNVNDAFDVANCELQLHRIASTNTAASTPGTPGSGSGSSGSQNVLSAGDGDIPQQILNHYYYGE